MLKKIVTILTQLLFFFTTSFISAVSGYYLLKEILPQKRVFGSWFRMFPYHHSHPVLYILIPCIFYSCVAVFFSKGFGYKRISKRIVILFLIIFLTLLFSFPVGGMLYFYHDMEAGYFPVNWIKRMMDSGIAYGFNAGWLIIALSFPYNFLGIIVCYFITKTGSYILIGKQLKDEKCSR